jgi:hypothetical protein
MLGSHGSVYNAINLLFPFGPLLCDGLLLFTKILLHGGKRFHYGLDARRNPGPVRYWSWRRRSLASSSITFWNMAPKMAGEMLAHCTRQQSSSSRRISPLNSGIGSASSNNRPLI